MANQKIQYTDHSQITEADAHICTAAADVATIRELSLEDINEFINGMMEYNATGQIPDVDSLFQPGMEYNRGEQV